MKSSIFAFLVILLAAFVAPSVAYQPEVDDGRVLTADQTAFFDAIDAGDLEAVKMWVEEKGMNIDQKDENTRSGLHRAIIANQNEVGKYLIDQHIDMHEVDNTYLCPLHYAAKYDRHELVEAILEYGLHPNKKNKDGKMPIHRAAMGTTPDAAKTMAILYKYGTYVDERDERGKTALNYAIAAGNKDSIDWLMSKGASLYYLSKKEQKKLHHLAPYIHHEL